MSAPSVPFVSLREVDMTDHPVAVAPSRFQDGYDIITIFFHWLTALLVVSLFASIELRGFLVQGTWIRSEMQPLHISLGILLLPTILLRSLWRLFSRGDRPAPTSGLMDIAAKLAHFGLYALLIAQVVLGFAATWAREGIFTFFGLFPLPRLINVDPSLRHTITDVHQVVAWAIILLAALHALAALVHHYVLRDDVLARMLPAARRPADRRK